MLNERPGGVDLTPPPTVVGLKGKHSVRAGKDKIRADRVFDATSSFNKFRNTKVLSKRT